MPSGAWATGVFESPAFERLESFTEWCAAFADWPTLEDLNRWLLEGGVRTVRGQPVRVIPQPPRSRRRRPRERSALYDVSVARGEVPTRAGSWHDVFNVGMFRLFRASKAWIHERHRRVIEAGLAESFERLPGARTREQDALALLDEGGVVVACEEDAERELERALAAGDAEAVRELVARRAVAPCVLGHALLEHVALVAPALSDPAVADPEQARPAWPRPLAVTVRLGADAPLADFDAALAERLREPQFLAEPPRLLTLPLNVWFPALDAR
jgi:hypothetical protein